MTSAQVISAFFNDDGQRWCTENGVRMHECIEHHGGVLTWRDGWRTGDTVRADFPDGSCITMAGDAWDIGFPGCFCWAGCGHDESCEAHA